MINRQRSPTECVRSRKTEVNGEVHGRRPRPTGAVVARGKNKIRSRNGNSYSLLLRGETRNAYRILVEKPEGKRKMRVGGWIILTG